MKSKKESKFFVVNTKHLEQLFKKDKEAERHFFEKVWQTILEGENAKLEPQKSELPSDAEKSIDCPGCNDFGGHICNRK